MNKNWLVSDHPSDLIELSGVATGRQEGHVYPLPQSNVNTSEEGERKNKENNRTTSHPFP